jgi:hypothetical protein
MSPGFKYNLLGRLNRAAWFFKLMIIPMKIHSMEEV